MKETFYFSHDYGARNDPKLVKLQMKLGHEGKGLYWDIIEMLYEQSGYLLLAEIETYSFELRTTYERITDVIQNYDLFKNDGEKFWSESVIERLKKREEKSNKARESVGKRWNNTNVIRTYNKRNTIKENKIKENKIKENNKNRYFESDRLNSLFSDFVTYRKQIKKPVTDRAIQLLKGQLQKLASDEATQCEIIEQSIMRGWQGFFELKQINGEQRKKVMP